MTSLTEDIVAVIDIQMFACTVTVLNWLVLLKI